MDFSHWLRNRGSAAAVKRDGARSFRHSAGFVLRRGRVLVGRTSASLSCLARGNQRSARPDRSRGRRRANFGWKPALIAVVVWLMAAATELVAQEPAGPSAPTAIPTRNLLSVIRDGGVLMIPIGACSVALGIFLLERFVSLRRARVIPKPFVTRFLEQLREGQLDRATALSLCEENRSAVAQVFGAAVKKWGRPAVEVEQAVIDEGERVITRLRRYLRVFHFISTVSPLLGLLGTVLGMIEAFNVIAAADAMGRAELLAGGISQALITTAAGLTVAIPALTAYSWFVARVDRLVVEIDGLAQQVVDCIAGDAASSAQKGEKSGSRRAA
jgi:biopolymer transport protein ExbB